MILRKNIKIAVICLFINYTFYGQDIHFSQYNNLPVLLNPSTTGAIAGDYRVACNYKDQWKNISNTFKTMAASFDTKLFKRGREKSNYLGFGITVFADKSGKSKLSTTQGNVSVSYNLRTSKRNNFSAGAQIGFFQKSVNIANLKWDNQYDGNTFDASRATGENDYSHKILSLDAGAGLLWRYQDIYSQFKFEAGTAILHINKPKNSFYANGQSLNIKYVSHIKSIIQLPNTPLYIIPQVLYIVQSPYSEMLVGGNIRYVIGEDTRPDASLNTFSLISSHLEFGIYYRLKDAMIFSMALDYKKRLTIGISYDVTVSKLKPANQLRGGLEISLMHRGLYRNSNIKHVPLD